MEIKYKDTMSDNQKQECLKISKLLKKYNINSIDTIQGCTLAEFLAKQHPEKYDNSIYKNTDELKQIFAIVNDKKNVAIFINLNKDSNSKLEYGDFAEQDLTNYKIKLAPEVEEKFKAQIEKMSHEYFSAKEQEEIFKDSFKGNLDSLEKIATIDFYLEHQAKSVIKDKLKEINEKNGKSVDEKDVNKEKQEGKTEDDSKKEKEEKVSLVDEKNEEEEKTEIPDDVKKACKRLGINKIKGYFYVNASDLNRKVDNTLVNKYGDRVLMLEVPSDKLEGPNRYYGMQGEKMVVYGNEDQAVRDVTGNITKMGKVVEPLKLQEPKEVKFDNKDGMVVNERLDDNMELSVQEANNYREEMEKLLEKYSREVELLKEDDDMELNEKLEKMRQNDGEFFSQANSIAQKYDISIDDRENIQTKVIENSVEAAKDETEEYEERDLNEKQAKEDDEYDGFDEVGRRIRPR